MADRPDWLETPEERFTLVMWGRDDSGSTDHEIDISRQEFVALKMHLAAMRGYAFDGTLGERINRIIAEVGSHPGEMTAGDDQVISHIQMARAVFRRYPEMVMLAGESVDEEIEAIYQATRPDAETPAPPPPHRVTKMRHAISPRS